MKILVSEKISPHKYKTPEGYLVCVDSILSRTGKQEYKKNEVFVDSDDDSIVEVDRTEKEVFSPQALASFENKPITIEHPDVDVTTDNHKDLSVGFVRDIKKGEFEGEPVMLGTLVITDADAIRMVEEGELEELSCGYDCDIQDEENPQQRNIRGNHVALCERGRAGIARIVDSVKDAKLPAKTKKNIQRVLAARSTFTKRDIDVSDIVNEIERYCKIDGTPCTLTRKSIKGWFKSGDGMMRKDYIFSVDGYDNHILISLYADPDTWKVTEANGYFVDSVNDAEFHRYTVSELKNFKPGTIITIQGKEYTKTDNTDIPWKDKYGNKYSSIYLANYKLSKDSEGEIELKDNYKKYDRFKNKNGEVIKIVRVEKDGEIGYVDEKNRMMNASPVWFEAMLKRKKFEKIKDNIHDAKIQLPLSYKETVNSMGVHYISRKDNSRLTPKEISTLEDILLRKSGVSNKQISYDISDRWIAYTTNGRLSTHGYIDEDVKDAKEYRIIVNGIQRAKWEANSAEEAVKEFLEANPAYANSKKGNVEARDCSLIADDEDLLTKAINDEVATIELYNTMLDGGLDDDTREIIEEIRDDENDHLVKLTKIKNGTVDKQDVVEDEDEVMLQDRTDKVLSEEAKKLKSDLNLYKKTSKSHKGTGTGAKRNINPWNSNITEAMNDALQLISEGIEPQYAMRRLEVLISSYENLLPDVSRLSGDPKDYGRLRDVISRAKRIKAKLMSLSKDSVEDECIKDDKKLRNGYILKYIGYGKSGRKYAIIYRPNVNDYLVAAGYNESSEDWGQGYYNIKTFERAMQMIKKAQQIAGDSMKDSKKKLSKKDAIDLIRKINKAKGK